MFTMQKMTNRQKAALETRKKLLAAAKRIISERGLAGTSVDEITEACGVAKGTFYTYFKRKEDVVYALCNEKFAEILDDAMSRKGTFMERLAFYMMGFASPRHAEQDHRCLRRSRHQHRRHPRLP